MEKLTSKIISTNLQLLYNINLLIQKLKSKLIKFIILYLIYNISYDTYNENNFFMTAII